MKVANVCLLLAVLVTTKECLCLPEKLFMIMVLSGKRFVNKGMRMDIGSHGTLYTLCIYSSHTHFSP